MFMLDLLLALFTFVDIPHCFCFFNYIFNILL